MLKKSLFLGLIIVLAALLLKLAVIKMSNMKLADFKPVSAVFLLDTSASNRSLIDGQTKTLLKIAKRLDSEDYALVYAVTEDAFNIYSGNPHKIADIKKSIEKRGAFDSKAYGTAYGAALKKAIGDALHYKANGYSPAVIILGDLENEGNIAKQINWAVLPKNIENTLKYIPDLKLVFLYADPKKLDYTRQLLLPVFEKNPKNLIFASEENAEQAVKQLMQTLGR